MTSNEPVKKVTHKAALHVVTSRMDFHRYFLFYFFSVGPDGYGVDHSLAMLPNSSHSKLPLVPIGAPQADSMAARVT